jgi:hypothetical protein
MRDGQQPSMQQGVAVAVSGEYVSRLSRHNCYD